MLSVLILAAGKSNRMKSSISKIFHHLGGRTLLEYVLETSKEITDNILVVLPKNKSITEKFIIQENSLGTGDAALVGLQNLTSQDVIIVFGDTPLLKPETLKEMYEYHKTHNNMITVSATETTEKGYGILNIDDDNNLVSIIESKNYVNKESQEALYNGGVMIVNRLQAIELLKDVKPDKKSNEIYLTKIVEFAYHKNLKSDIFNIAFEETIGINTRSDMAKVEMILQQKWRKQAIDNGVSMIDPNTVFFSYDTKITDTLLYPFIYFDIGVNITSSTIYSFTNLKNTTIKSHSKIGPFASLKNSEINESVTIGNFTDMQRSTIGSHSKMKHFSYIGDSKIGSKVNIGAGAVTCNFDGVTKHKTVIKDSAFIGANTSIIAPCVIEENSLIGAGTVITKNTEKNSKVFSKNKLCVE